MSMQTSCCFSTVSNTSGKRKTFGFLPPHGRTLAAGEEYSVFGDIREAVQREGYASSRRHMQAMLDALAGGDMYIVGTPNAILEDIAHEGDPTRTKVQTLLNGVIVLYDPSFESVSEDTDPRV